MRKVFISYSWRDVAFVEAAHERLEGSKYAERYAFEFWRDRKAHMQDRWNRWEPDIWDQFKHSQLVLFFVSKDAMLAGSFAQAELEEARAQGKFVIPVLLEAVSTLDRSYAGVYKAIPRDCPPLYEGGREPTDAALDTLVQEFGALLGEPPVLPDRSSELRAYRVTRVMRELKAAGWDHDVMRALDEPTTEGCAEKLVDGGLKQMLIALLAAAEANGPRAAGSSAGLLALLGRLIPMAFDEEGRVYLQDAAQSNSPVLRTHCETLEFVEIGMAQRHDRQVAFVPHPIRSRDWVGRRYVHVPWFDAGVDPTGDRAAEQTADEVWRRASLVDVQRSLARKFELQSYTATQESKRVKGRLGAEASRKLPPYYLALPADSAVPGDSVEQALSGVRQLYPALQVVHYDVETDRPGEDEYECRDLLDTLLRIANGKEI